MHQHDRDYVLPDGTGLQEIKALLQTRCSLSEDAAHKVTRTFYDTFDWRLYQGGAALEEVLENGRRTILWHDLAGEGPTLGQGSEAPPGLARDLPPGPVSERAAPAIGIRCLLPLLQVESRTHTLRILDEEEKTVVRLSVEENRFNDAARERQGSLATRLRLLPVKGYAGELRGTVRMLDEDLGLSGAHIPLLLEALAAAGRRPGDYSSQIDYHLDPEKRADATAKEILHGLLDAIEVNVEGTIANLDSEFLHDLRVAIRRTRSALSQIKAVFTPEMVERYKERFAWLQQITGPVRDLDVYLLDFDGYQAKLPIALKTDLEPMRTFLLAHYDEEQRKLADALRSKALRDLLRDWRAFLEAPVPARSAVPNATRPTKNVADERIWRMYRRVRKEGRAITPDSPPEELHELRKSCKKLRYLLEFFSSLYPKKKTRGLVKLLKGLLNNLGRFQDLAVQAQHLIDLAQRMRDEGCAETKTLLAMGVLVGDLLEHQQQARAEFAEIFAEFDDKEHQALFRELFAPHKQRGGGE